MNQSKKMCKISFPMISLKMYYEHIERIEGIEKSWKISVMKGFFKTYYIPKFEHFLCKYLQLTMKSWNYVLESKWSQNIRNQNTHFCNIIGK